MTTIVGVDFSGAATDLNTWFAQGRLDDGNLVLDRVQPIRREDLYNLMLGLTAPAVAAMDFPFGLPEEFLPHIGVTDDYQTIDEIWTILADIDRQYLEDVAAEFVRDYAEPHRVVERHYPESSSTLHRVNPDMLPMTYLGCRLLSRWWDHEDRPPWHVLPLEATRRTPGEVRHRHGDDARSLSQIGQVALPELQRASTYIPSEPGPHHRRTGGQFRHSVAQSGRMALRLPRKHRLP